MTTAELLFYVGVPIINGLGILCLLVFIKGEASR